MPKYIFVTGGVVSSLGKGIASAAIGKLMESRGLTITIVKCDPYINVDPGTMNPYEHGEVYVTEDGAEADLDLGHYERFTDAVIGRDSNITTGKIYHYVISKERKGEYLGKTVQVIPHITDEIKRHIKKVTRNTNIDIVIVEIGGTIGDIESLPFLEAIRQLRIDVGYQNCINIHVTLVPYIKSAGEIKTKPTQHSVGVLRQIGIQPDILLCRSEKELSQEAREKIALFCNVDKNAVIPALDVSSVYEVPLMFAKENLDQLVTKLLGIKSKDCDLNEWTNKVVNIIKAPTKQTKIAVVGKYITLQDAYKSIYEALVHGGIANNAKVEIIKVDSEDISEFGVLKYLKNANAVLVPGGFGYRGIEGKFEAIQFARENKLPFFGICLGMQSAVIEFARNVCGFEGANSIEFDKNTKYPVISLLEEQKEVADKGGTMRLGAYACRLEAGTKSFFAYEEKKEISERHRHRYEFNNEYKNVMKDKGLVFAGTYAQQELIEIIELKDHPWFVACQFHPEFKSKPDRAHPLFREFVKASIERG
ncbi:MAG: CTP synthase [Candidatus Omnitrophota bacterium]